MDLEIRLTSISWVVRILHSVFLLLNYPKETKLYIENFSKHIVCYTKNN